MDVTFGNLVQSREWLGGAVDRGLLGGAECRGVDHSHWYRHELWGVAVGMLSTGIQKFELDPMRQVVEVGGGSGCRRMVEAGGGSGRTRMVEASSGNGWWRVVEVGVGSG